MKYNLALFASGSGSNVENIFNYYKGHKSISVSSVLTNNKNAYVLKRAKKLNIESYTFDSNNDESQVLSFLLSNNITHIILAGYLKLISPKLIEIYKDKILNIHIKDRNLRGDTVPLGEGEVNFFKIFKNLKNINYSGNFILQTARAQNNDHLQSIIKYKKFVDNIIHNHLI